MERTYIKSGFIAAIGYNAETKTLEIEFAQGRIYQYFGVEPETHKALMDAESKGKHFSAFINGRYEYKRMVELEAQKPQEQDKLL